MTQVDNVNNPKSLLLKILKENEYKKHLLIK